MTRRRHGSPPECCIAPLARQATGTPTRNFASDLHGKHSSTKSELQPPGGHRRGGLETLLPSLRTLSRAAGTQSCAAIKLCVGSQHISPRNGTLKGGCDAISNLGPISFGNDSARIRHSDSDNCEKAPVSARSIDPAWALLRGQVIPKWMTRSTKIRGHLMVIKRGGKLCPTLASSSAPP